MKTLAPSRARAEAIAFWRTDCGVSLGDYPGRGSRIGPWLLGAGQGTASLPRRVTASFGSAALTRRGPMTGVRDLPDRGPNNETPAAGLDT
jgi:hypothetical protein